MAQTNGYISIDLKGYVLDDLHMLEKDAKEIFDKLEVAHNTHKPIILLNVNEEGIYKNTYVLVKAFSYNKDINYDSISYKELFSMGFDLFDDTFSELYSCCIVVGMYEDVEGNKRYKVSVID